jgi:methionyl-tRNA formyltransferase
MRIFIVAMDDFLFINHFMKAIIANKSEEIIGVAIVKKCGRLTISKNRSRVAYIFALLFIMGVVPFSVITLKGTWLRIKHVLSKFLSWLSSPSILAYAAKLGIPTYQFNTANDTALIKLLQSIRPDVIIHQSQNFLCEDFLSAAKVGVVNRHNSLLPKNRGRLSPFWALYKGEKECGVSVHFATKNIDSGDIISQRSFPIEERDNFNTLVKKCYQLAVPAMLEALDLLQAANYIPLPNRDSEATTNSIPSIKEALLYRLNVFKKKLNS